MALQNVLELDHELGFVVEQLKAAQPIFQSQEGLLVRIELSEDLLQ